MEPNEDDIFQQLFMESSDDEPTNVHVGEEEKNEVETPEGEKQETTIEEQKEVKKTESKEEEVEEKEIAETEKSDSLSFEPFVSELVDEGFLSPEEIEEKGFENSIEGVKEILKHSVSKAKEQGKTEFLSELSEDAKRLIELEKQGVDIRQLLETEAEEIDYDSIDLDDIENQQDLYYNYLIESGLSEEKAARRVDISLQNGTLAEDSETSKDFLANKQRVQKEQMIASQKAEAKKAELENKKAQEEFVKNILDTKEIRGFQVSQAENAKLLERMYKPVDKSGKTQEMIDFEDLETRKAFNYFVMKGFDFKSMEKKAQTKATIKLKEKVLTNSDKGLSNKGTKVQTNNESGGGVPSVEFLFGQ